MENRLPSIGQLSRRGALGVAIGGLSASIVRAAAAPAAWSTIDTLCESTLKDHVAPGISVSVMKEGAFVYSKGFGFSNLETMTQATPKSVFRIGSLTKQFTGAAIVCLAEDGKLSYEDRLSRFLPDFPRAGDITLRQMLNHTSGLGNYTTVANFMQLARVDYDARALQIAMAEMTKPLFTFEPGTNYAYSNTAYVLLGLVIEKITGAPYGVFYKDRLFTPAGMIATAVDDAADVVPNRASGYTLHPGSDAVFYNASFISMSFPGGAGSICSTAEDLCRWRSALLGGKIVRAAGLAEILKPGRLNDGSLPKIPTAPGKDAPKKDIRYGFGMEIESFDGRRMITHKGGINGFLSNLSSFPDEKITVATLVNCDGGLGLQQRAVIDHMLAIDDAAARLALA